jgi:hypothetical protein
MTGSIRSNSFVPPEDELTEQEVDLLQKALIRQPTEVKRSIAREVREQCLGAVAAPTAVYRKILEKLGYENLRPEESAPDT